eukprot:SM000007S21005  [mRNA]  locus=s7:1309236:1311657:- [translate_table: standard]
MVRNEVASDFGAGLAGDAAAGRSRPSGCRHAPYVHPGHRPVAFVTLLMGAGDYFMGVVALAKSLEAVGSKHPLLVAVTPDVPSAHRQSLKEHGCLLRDIEPVSPPEGVEPCSFVVPYYQKNFTKLRVWQFDDFEKLVYLDADVLVVQSIDELFDQPSFGISAVLDCFCEPSWSGSIQYQLKYCQQEPGQHFLLNEEARPTPYFNAGVLVLSPSSGQYDDMMNIVKSRPPTPFAEQDFLNEYFRGIYLHPLPLQYNLVLAFLWRHPQKVDLSKVKIVHFCAKGSKPWKFHPDEQHMDLPEVYNGNSSRHVETSVQQSSKSVVKLELPAQSAAQSAGAFCRIRVE